MHSTADTAPRRMSATRLRASGFLAFWLILTGFSPADLPAGVVATVAATWASLLLLPPAPRTVQPVLFLQLALRFMRQSIVAGVDTAWRALDPRLPVRPGIVIYRPNLSPGPTRNAFCTMVSLLPGTLPSGANENGDLVVHCLDTSQPVQRQLADEEARFIAALGGVQGDD